jgi:ribosomal protein L34E
MPLLCCNMKEENFYPQRESFPTNCENCGTPIETEVYRNKGAATDGQPYGHKDPRHSFGCYCSVDCSKDDGGNGTIYRKA